MAVEDTWTAKADMPTARGYLATAVVNGKIYAIGGAYSSTSGSSAVEEYDPAKNIWIRKANMPQARSGFSTIVIDEKIYVIGGGASPYGVLRSSMYIYDPATDTWTQKAQMPTPRTGLSANIVDGKIYVIGGSSASVSAGLKTVEVYDPDENNWTRKADMPTARFDHRTSVVGGKIYVIGGTTGSPWAGMSVVEVYDPANDSWTRKANMPTPRWGFVISEVDGKIYAIGGASAPSWFSTVEQYNPATNIWITKTPMSIRRREFSASVVGGKIYAIGGASGNQGATYALATVEEYDTGLTASQPDINGDGIIDIKDLLRIVEFWNQNDPIVDIAPYPFGDGIVDVLDLDLLLSLWEQPVDDTTLVAFWTLDEAEGTIALDSAGINDAIIFGNPLWQPDSGMIDGAIQLDGIDDCVIVGSNPNIIDGPFSVIAWVKGGGPGQIVLSQIGGSNWLSADPIEGNLLTELQKNGRSGKPLLSQTNITDGYWHRISLVWDGSNRTLYVDGIAVAEDTQDSLEDSNGGLYLGCGKGMEVGTYWSGLIDDVRIYNRVVIP